ncbi:O-antigen ligase family protein [Natronococcus roseus]|uniref:O-antigen ligase family protein n=1 Tax=Natronococcus roseus TaxID=1052014 RepID=UPI00374D8041
MSTAERDSATSLIRSPEADRLLEGTIYGLFALYLFLVLVAQVTDAIPAWQLSVAAIVLGAVLGTRLAVVTDDRRTHRWAAILSVFGITGVLAGLLYQTSSPGFGVGSSRVLAIGLAFAVLLSFVLVVTDARRYTAGQWAVVGCFAVIVGVYLAHTLAFVPSSTQSRWPVWAATVMGVSLFVLPRLVPGRVFLRVLSGFAAIVVALGVATYVVGDYTLWLFEVGRYTASSPSVPGFDPDILTLQSVFPNPNGLGLLSFAGFVAAVVELHRSLDERRPIGTPVAAVLAVTCGIGLFLSNARAAMLAAAVATAIYAAYAVGDRKLVPVAVATTTLGVFGVIAAMALEVVGISATGRFELWAASLSAIGDGPLLFGHGSGPANTVIEPYLPREGAPTPHNSYLSVLIQTGLVGGLAYIGLVAGSIVARTVTYREVDVAMLALAVGWAIHQFFESYTMFDWSVGAVLATAAIGYLVFGHRAEPRP